MPTFPRPRVPSQAVSQFRRWTGGRGALVALGALGLVAVAVPACATAQRSAALRGGSAAQPGKTAGLAGAVVAERAATAPMAQPDQASGASVNQFSSAGASDASKAVAAQASGSARSAAPAPQTQPAPPDQQPLPPLPVNERMVIKDGTLTLEVSDLAEAMQRVNAAVAAISGAYVSASSTSYRADITSASAGTSASVQGRTLPPVPPRPSPAPSQAASVTIKVPVDSFGDLLQRLREAGKPLQENVSTQEVTEEYVDLAAQVRNLEATEQQYQQLLQRAQTIQEILPIQQRLSEVRNQIERLRGRMNLLQRRADLSTVTLTLLLPSQVDALSAAPRVARTLQDALARLGAVLLVALDAVIYLAVYALPVLPFVVAYWWWRRGRRPAAGAPTTAPTGAAM